MFRLLFRHSPRNPLHQLLLVLFVFCFHTLFCVATHALNGPDPANFIAKTMTSFEGKTYAQKEEFLHTHARVKIRPNPWSKKRKTTDPWYHRWTNQRNSLKLSTAVDASFQWSSREEAMSSRNLFIDKLLELYGSDNDTKKRKTNKSKSKICHPRRSSLRSALVVQSPTPRTPTSRNVRKNGRNFNAGRPISNTPKNPNTDRTKRASTRRKATEKMLLWKQRAVDKLGHLPSKYFEQVRQQTLDFTTYGGDGLFSNLLRETVRAAEAEMKLSGDRKDWQRCIA